MGDESEPQPVVNKIPPYEVHINWIIPVQTRPFQQQFYQDLYLLVSIHFPTPMV